MSELNQSSVNLLERAIDDKIRKAVRGGQSTHLATVTRISNDGTTWVRVYGGAEETPVRRMTTAASVGDVINVTFSGLSCMGVGNVSSPSATTQQVTKVADDSNKAVKGVMDGLLQVEHVIADKVSSKELDAEVAIINQALINKANVNDLQAATGRITNLESATADIEDIRANSAKVENLTAQELEADHATVSNLSSNYAHITNGVIDNAHIGQANVDDLSANYAKLDASNIGTATIREGWIDALMVQSGLIAHEGTVFTLDAIQVNASNITAGTIDVQRLVVTVDGEKYMVHFDPQTSQPSYQKLDGDVIEDLTITADKIVAGAITADKITTENIAGSGGWINLRSGTFQYVNAQTGEGISWDGSHLSIAGSVTIGGGSMELSEIAENASTPRFYISEEYSQDGASVTVTAHVMVGGTDVTTSYPGSCFAWYTKSESGEAPLVPIQSATGYSVTLSRSVVGYGAAVVCRFTEPNDSVLLDGDDDTLTDSQGTPVTGRTPSGDYVRIADLETTTTVFGTDKLLLVGNEDEKLITVSTLKDYLEMTVAKQVEFGTTAYWNARPSLVSESHTLYVYTDHSTDSHGNSIAGIKVGDGSAYLIDLPFTDALETEHRANTGIHVTSEERAFWNNKVRAYYAASEQLVLTTA